VRNDKNCRPRHQTAIWGLTAPVQDRDSFWSGQTLSRWCRVAITTSSVSKLNVLPAGVFCRANARLHTGADPQLPRTSGSVRRPIYVEYQCGTASTAIQKGEKNYSPAACDRRRIRRTGSREAQERVLIADIALARPGDRAGRQRLGCLPIGLPNEERIRQEMDHLGRSR
jgi:hypothetical protein